MILLVQTGMHGFFLVMPLEFQMVISFKSHNNQNNSIQISNNDAI